MRGAETVGGAGQVGAAADAPGPPVEGLVSGREQLRLQWEFRQWRSDAAALVARCPAGTLPPEPVQTLRWLIEEFGISLFAQELGTLQAVSTKRLVRQREAALAAIAGRAPAPNA